MATTTTILRESSVPTSFKFRAEEEIGTFVTQSGEKRNVLIGLNENPTTHSNNSVDGFGAFFVACASAMSDEQFKNKEKSALVFSKPENGEVVMALISEYDEEGENYNYTFTFDSEDIKGIKSDSVVNSTDFKSREQLEFNQLFDAAYMRSHNICILDKSITSQLILCMITVIRDWLDTNAPATDGDIVELIIDDTITQYELCSLEEYKKKLIPVAIASCETVKGIKKMAIQFSEELKAIAKGNSDK